MGYYESSAESFAPPGGSYPGEAPRRRHRRVEPWRDCETGKPLLASPKERATHATSAPLQALVRALAADQPFLEAIERVRADSESVDQIARRYVRREGRGREVMRRVIERAAASASSNPQQRILGVGITAVFINAPLAADDPTTWTHAKRLPQAAAMLARLGAGGCLQCGSALAASDGARRRYCAAHAKDAWLRERADQDAILALLNGAARALSIN